MRIFSSRLSITVLLVSSAWGGGAPAAATGVEAARAATAYVGSKACSVCHASEFEAWEDSAHAWAMRRSLPGQSVADFDHARVSFGNGGSALLREDGGRLTARVLEPATEPRELELQYFFGHAQVEQHLVAGARGRLQALPFGFDTRRHEWFDIFAGDPRPPGDWGHWTGRGMTANSECTSCHSTGYKKNYDLATDSYDSRWAEAAVGCEACHGPGAAHVDAASGDARDADARAARSEQGYGNLDPERMLDACASCHALRRVIAEGFVPGGAFLDFFEPVLLDEASYRPDGLVRGESYEWASFVQSRMYRENVRCPDCHEIHGAKLKQQGNGLCLGCHDPILDTASHSHHTPASEGSRCVACHMPERVFMQRDSRRDHSFSIPDPELAESLGLGNACNDCHKGKSAAWAADTVEGWFVPGGDRKLERAAARAIAAARAGRDGAGEGLLRCLKECEDGVRRASVARLLAGYLRAPGAAAALAAAVRDGEGMVRAGAVFALGQAERPDPDLQKVLLAAAADPLRVVRINAAWGLRGFPAGRGPVHTRAREARAEVETATREWKDAQLVEAEDAESHHALGLFYTAQGRNADAESAYRQALALAPEAIPPRYNLSVLLTRQGRTDEAEMQVEQMLRHHRDYPAALYALGVLRAARGATHEAVSAFAHCLEVDPAYPGALHDLAHAYVTLGEGDRASKVLEAALRVPASKREALITLVTANLALGEREVAAGWAQIAADEFPELARDATVQSLLEGRTGKADQDSRPNRPGAD